jgi:hypothetical protein
MYDIISVDGKYRLLNTRSMTVTAKHFNSKQDAKVEATEENRYEHMARSETAMQAGMAFGVQGYNEAMGSDSETPEPCGHHCHSDCPRCGCENE